MSITTKTDIANLALSELGARRITDYAALTTTESRATALHLDQVANALLRSHQWNFATARATLAAAMAGTPPAAVTPPAEWGAVWALPADLVRLIRVSSGDADQPVRDFAMEGRRLLTVDATAPEIVYVTNGAAVSEWDALFVEAMKFALAAAIAPDVTQNPALQAACLQKLESLALPKAQTADAREVASGENFGPRQLAARSGLVAARFASTGRPPYIPTA